MPAKNPSSKKDAEIAGIIDAIFRLEREEKIGGSIPYRPRINKVLGSINATILLQQIWYWFQKSNYNPFFKFREPCSSDQYRPGDSWVESIGFTKHEFDMALSKIGKKVVTGDNKTEIYKTSIVIYWTDSNRLTYYDMNLNNYAKLIKDAYQDEYGLGISAFANYLQRIENIITYNGNDLDIPLVIDSTETTTKNTKTLPEARPGAQSSEVSINGDSKPAHMDSGDYTWDGGHSSHEDEVVCDRCNNVFSSEDNPGVYCQECAKKLTGYETDEPLRDDVLVDANGIPCRGLNPACSSDDCYCDLVDAKQLKETDIQTCTDCKGFRLSQQYWNVSGRYVCSDCYTTLSKYKRTNDDVVMCDRCNNVFNDEDLLTFDGKLYCQDCMNSIRLEAESSKQSNVIKPRMFYRNVTGKLHDKELDTTIQCVPLHVRCAICDGYISVSDKYLHTDNGLAHVRCIEKQRNDRLEALAAHNAGGISICVYCKELIVDNTELPICKKCAEDTIEIIGRNKFVMEDGHCLLCGDDPYSSYRTVYSGSICEKHYGLISETKSDFSVQVADLRIQPQAPVMTVTELDNEILVPATNTNNELIEPVNVKKKKSTKRKRELASGEETKKSSEYKALFAAISDALPGDPKSRTITDKKHIGARVKELLEVGAKPGEMKWLSYYCKNVKKFDSFTASCLAKWYAAFKVSDTYQSYLAEVKMSQQRQAEETESEVEQQTEKALPNFGSLSPEQRTEIENVWKELLSR